MNGLTGPGAQQTFTVGSDGNVCYSFRLGALGTGVFIPVCSWLDANGAGVASGMDGSATCADGSGSFVVDYTAPECADWFFGPECDPGVCPEFLGEI